MTGTAGRVPPSQRRDGKRPSPVPRVGAAQLRSPRSTAVPESYGGASRRWSHDQVKVASVKRVSDPPVGLAQKDRLRPHRPVTRKRPLIELQAGWRRIDMAPVVGHTSGRFEALGPVIPEIVFR